MLNSQTKYCKKSPAAGKLLMERAVLDALYSIVHDSSG